MTDALFPGSSPSSVHLSLPHRQTQGLAYEVTRDNRFFPKALVTLLHNSGAAVILILMHFLCVNLNFNPHPPWP